MWNYLLNYLIAEYSKIQSRSFQLSGGYKGFERCRCSISIEAFIGHNPGFGAR
jgi:hypothetical protein